MPGAGFIVTALVGPHVGYLVDRTTSLPFPAKDACLLLCALTSSMCPVESSRDIAYTPSG
jgi:hypothetical protein